MNVSVAVKDVFDNAIPGYTGTVHFANYRHHGGCRDACAASRSLGADAGIVTTTATFVTVGPQTLTASDSSSPAATGSATSDVHGLVYTAPDTGRVRLVANAAQSTAQVVQLDLVANERLEVSTFFGGGPGSFAAGMNLPLDTTRVTRGCRRCSSPGNALAVGTAPAGGDRRASARPITSCTRRCRASASPARSSPRTPRSRRARCSTRCG